ncbi:MAG: GerAB/ArcD/ProY family transporter [Acutalibacteraceae bacterium]
MLSTSQISGGQLAALLLVSRLSVAMTYSATRHQLSNGLDFVLSIVLQSVLLLLLFLPLWWFSRRTGGAGTLDYGYLLFGRGGAVLAVIYALICLYVQAVELIRFRYFVTTVLSPDMPVVILCIVLVLAAYSAALYGVESLARAAAIAAVLIAAVIAFIAFALMPEMDAAYFPPFLYDGFSPVIAGLLEETPRTMEIAVLGLMLPYCRKKTSRALCGGAFCWRW